MAGRIARRSFCICRSEWRRIETAHEPISVTKLVKIVIASTKSNSQCTKCPLDERVCRRFLDENWYVYRPDIERVTNGSLQGNGASSFNAISFDAERLALALRRRTCARCVSTSILNSRQRQYQGSQAKSPVPTLSALTWILADDLSHSAMFGDSDVFDPDDKDQLGDVFSSTRFRLVSARSNSDKARFSFFFRVRQKSVLGEDVSHLLRLRRL